MRFKELILSAVAVVFFGLYAFSVSSAFKIDPMQPVQGDAIKLTGSCTAGSNIPISLEFSRDVAVSSGKYDYEVGTIEIPSGSTLSVRAENVLDMKLGMKVFIWFTMTVQASNGVASYSTSLISGRKTLKVFGNALSGASVVKLRFTAQTPVKCDNLGSLLFTFDSRYLPLGAYTITVGGERQTIQLLGSRPVTPTPTPSLTPTPSPTPPPKTWVVLVANDVDYGLSRDLVVKLIPYGIGVVRSSSPESCALILGGPDAYNGVGVVVRGFLTSSEVDLIRVDGSKVFLRKGRTFIVAGSDRDMTYTAFKERFVEVAANLVSCGDEVSKEVGL